jgi:hypothetical protein
MSTLHQGTPMSASMWHLAWTAIVLLPLTASAATEDAIAGPDPADDSRVAQPEVWLCAGDRIMELLQPGAEWPFVQQHLKGIKLYIGQLHGKRRETKEQTTERLRPLAHLVQAHHLQVAVELGGCLDFSPMDDTAGEWSAQTELAALANYYAAGGQVDYLDLDGPIRRLLHPENRPDGRRFDSIDKAADELVDALKLHRATHPETNYWLLTNFPNWGWRGDVSYHARGPQRQDYGDYDQVVRIVLEKFRTADMPLDGVTVDNPYDYLVGEHSSVQLADPKSVDWLTRVRRYEDFARAELDLQPDRQLRAGRTGIRRAVFPRYAADGRQVSARWRPANALVCAELVSASQTGASRNGPAQPDRAGQSGDRTSAWGNAFA